jgi:hypothetical protein
MRIVLLTLSAATYLAIGTAMLFEAGRLPAASPPAVPQAIPAVALAPPARTDELLASTLSEPAPSPTVAPVLRVKTVRVDPIPPPTEVEAQQQPTPEPQPAEASMVHDSTPTPANEPATTIPPRRAGRTHGAPTRLKTADRAAKRKIKLSADETSASDGALSYASRQPGLDESVNPLSRLFSR